MRRPSLFSDFAQMASGAASAFGGMRGEVDVMVQSQVEKILAKRGLVAREDFDAAEARITALGVRIANLESQLAALQEAQGAKSARKSAKKS
jgi:BMFP domain-containing protein YqiC